MPDINLSPYTAQQSQIEQRRRMAELLSQQSMQPLDTNQTAGGYVVPVSPYAGLAKLLQGYTGGMGQRRASQDQMALGQQYRSDQMGDISALAKMLASPGSPATPERAPVQDPQEIAQQADGMSQAPPNIPAQPAMAAGQISPDMMGQFKTPEGQQMAMAQLLAQNKPKEPIKLGKDESLIDPRTFKPIMQAPQQPKYHVVGGNLVAEPTAPGKTVAPAFTAPDKDAGVWGATYDLGGAQVQRNSRTGEIRQAVVRPPVTNNVTTVNNAGPKAFETELGKLDAGQLGKWRDNALAGQQTLGIAENLRGAIKSGVFSGGLAQTKTAVSGLINGITGVTPKALPGSELFNAEASKLVLEKIKTLGANPSNSDREFIERTVPQLGNSPQARDQLINFLETKANESIKLYQSADAHARKNNGLKGFNMFGPAKSEGSILEQADAIIGGNQ